MRTVSGLKYSKEHEWVKAEGNKAQVGITDHAQDALGEIVYVELPQIGAELALGDAVGVVESVKAASDVYTPISGKVVEINGILEESPEKINEDPYDSWIAVLEIKDISELDGLMDEEEYKKFCGEES